MQALSYLHDVQDMLQEEGQNFVANSEEKARVESLIGQVHKAAVGAPKSFLNQP